MPDCTLFALDHAAAETLATEPAAFTARHQIELGAHEATVVAIAAATARMTESGVTPAPWGGYLALDANSRCVVGACGFKGGPGPDRAVEIAYFTFPGEEGRGVATAMAAALVRVASADASGVVLVRAHTLPERGASCRVLEKVEFTHTADVIDPEDGAVWRWERPVNAAV